MSKIDQKDIKNKQKPNETKEEVAGDLMPTKNKANK